MNNFGPNLKRLRLSRQLSQVELSELTNLKGQWISHLESGRRTPSLSTIEKLLSVFEPDELFAYIKGEVDESQAHPTTTRAHDVTPRA